MAYKFVPYAPEGSGGKDPILGELVVTENGVYDEPTSNGEVVISWDGNPDGHELGSMLMGESDFPLVKVSDKALTASDLTGAIARVFGMNEPVELVDGLAPLQVSETMAFAVDGMIVSGSGSFSTEYASIELPTAGTYFLYMGEGEMYATEITLPNASTPADGWNKVTVNVAGDIIDVPELPTENIEEGKIYRVTKESEESAIIYAVNVQDLDNDIVYNGDYAELSKNLMEQMGFTVTTKLYVVDALPNEFEAPIMDTSNRIVETVYYVLRGTGESYQIAANGGVGMAISLNEATGASHHGIISDPSEATEDGFYTIMIPAESSTTYGIPDEANNKTVMEYNGSEWVECGGGNGKVVEIATTEELDAILANATIGDVGCGYLYTGETTEAYENSCVYVVREE